MRGELSPAVSVFVAERSWVLLYNPSSLWSVVFNIQLGVNSSHLFLLLLCIRRLEGHSKDRYLLSSCWA